MILIYIIGSLGVFIFLYYYLLPYINRIYHYYKFGRAAKRLAKGLQGKEKERIKKASEESWKWIKNTKL